MRTRVRAAFLDDVELPQKWSNAVLNDHINEVLRQAILRAGLLKGRETFTSKAGQALYELGCLLENVLYIRSVANETTGESLRRTTVDELIDSHYKLSDTGTPTHFMEDDERELSTEYPVVRLYPVPTATTTKTYTVRYVRMPKTLVRDADTPEIPTMYHDWLLYGVAWLCYQFQDEDTYDPVKATYFENEFAKRFGPLLSANVIRERQQRNYLTVVVDGDMSDDIGLAI